MLVRDRRGSHGQRQLLQATQEPAPAPPRLPRRPIFSNMFCIGGPMALPVLVDVAYRPGPLLAAIDAGQAVAAVGAIALMALALTAIVLGAETRIRRLEPNAVVLLLAYLGTLFAVWRVRP